LLQQHFKFIIFSIFEMRYLLLIWKSRRPQAFSEGGMEGTRRELSMLYARFYAFLLSGGLLIYYLNDAFHLFILIMYSFWIPQIICNITRDCKHPLKPQYIIGTSLARLLIPLYFYGCPQNFIHMEPNPRFCVVLFCYVSLQALFLILQDQFGSRFCVPKMFFPKKYEYNRPILHSERECVICMSTIETGAVYMIAPCDHVFHEVCLTRWMDCKMECPICRRPLPPV